MKAWSLIDLFDNLGFLFLESGFVALRVFLLSVRHRFLARRVQFYVGSFTSYVIGRTRKEISLQIS